MATCWLRGLTPPARLLKTGMAGVLPRNSSVRDRSPAFCLTLAPAAGRWAGTQTSAPLHRAPTMRTLLCLATVLLGPVAVGAAPPFPGGLLDSTGRTAYASTAGGVAAVDLASGDVQWQTRLASQPLVVAGDRLYALALGESNRLFVRGFDLGGKGEKVFESSPVELPRWAVPRNGPGHSFSYRYRQDRNRLEITWQARAGSTGGPGKEAAGLAVIDLDSGKVRQENAAPPAPLAPPRVLPQMAKLAVRWQRSLAGQLVALVVEEMPGSTPARRRQRLVLRSWNERTGKETPPRELLCGARPVFLVGLDDRHLWVRDAGCPDEPSSSGPGALSRHWSVFAAVDGQLVARVPLVPGTRAATIIDDRAYCLCAGGVRATPGGIHRAGRVLHAIDLGTGKVLWSRPILAPAGEQVSC